MLVAGEFFFDPSMSLFKRHFPGRPVVPGSLILGTFLKEISGVWGIPCTYMEVERFHFMRFVSPGTYGYEIERSGPRVLCRLIQDNMVFARGSIRLRC